MAARVARLRLFASWQLDRIRVRGAAAKLEAQGFDRVRVQAADTAVLCGRCSSAFGVIAFDDVSRFPLHPQRVGSCLGRVCLTGAWRPLNILERLLAYLWDRRYEPMWAETILLIAIFAVILFLIPLYLLAWLAAVPTLLVHFPEVRHDPYAQGTAVAVLLLLAALLYWVRRTNRALYGVGEIAIGAILCWSILSSNEPDDLTTALKLGAAVYIVVRGLDNSYEGWGQRTFWHVLTDQARRTYRRYVGQPN